MGRVSRYGLIAYGSSLDQIRPITKTVADAALLLEVIAGVDARDSTTLPVDVPNYADALTGDIAGMRIGIPHEYFVEGIQPEGRGRGAGRDRTNGRAGRGDRADPPAQHGVGAAGLLSCRYGGGQRQSCPL